MNQRLRVLVLALVVAGLGLAVWRWWPEERDLTLPEAGGRPGESDPLPPRLEGAPTPPPSPPTPPPPAVRPLETRLVEGRVLDIASKEGVPYVHVVGGWNTYDLETRKMGRRVFETDADRDGGFRLEVTEGSDVLGFFEVADPSWRVYRFHAEDQEEARFLRLPDAGTTHVVLWVRRTFRLQGTVRDDAGSPLERARLRYTNPARSGNVTQLMSTAAFTDGEGGFDVGPLDADPGAGLDAAARDHLARYALVTVDLEGFAPIRFDPRAIPEAERDRVLLVLTRGVTLAGVLVDDHGRPLPDAVVAAEYGDDWELRRGTRTDAEGRWRLETVTPRPLALRARSFVRDAIFEREMTPTADDFEMRLVAETIRLSREPRTHRALGLELVEVDDEIRAAYAVPEYVHVLIWHPGEDPDALGIGRLEKGYGLMTVGEKRITSIEEAVEELLVQRKGARPGPWGRWKRVVYTFWNERMAGTNTQHVTLTDEHVRVLEDLRERLKR